MKMRYQISILWSLLNLNQNQTSSSSNDEEESAEYKVKRISNNEWCKCAVQKQSLADVLQNRCQAWNFITKRLQHRCFPKKFTKSFRKNTCFHRTSLLWWLLLAVNSVNQLKHTLKVYAAEKGMIYLNATSKVSVSR